MDAPQSEPVGARPTLSAWIGETSLRGPPVDGSAAQPFLQRLARLGHYHLMDPVSKVMMAIAGIWNLFGTVQGSGDIF
jgi:hypothetical protein